MHDEVSLQGLANMSESNNMFVVEGVIQNLRLSSGTINLVEDIQKGALFTGVMAGLAGQSGMFANAASLSLYDGEDVEHIALLINGQMAIGTFEFLQDIKVGDEVKLVVLQLKDGPLFIHSILRLTDQLLWTPYSIDHTRRGWILHGVKMSLLGLGLTWGFFGIIFLVRGKAPDGLGLNMLIWGGLVMMLFVGFMSTRSVMNLGKEAEDIFQALAVPKFERFRIKPYSLMLDYSAATVLQEGPSNRGRKGHIFKFDKALADHKKRLGLT